MKVHQIYSNMDRETSRLTSCEPQTYMVAAYSAEFNKDNPSPESVLTVGDVDGRLACILQESRRNNLSAQATQAAVWMWTDRVSFENMNHKLPITGADWSAGVGIYRVCGSSALEPTTHLPLGLPTPPNSTPVESQAVLSAGQQGSPRGEFRVKYDHGVHLTDGVLGVADGRFSYRSSDRKIEFGFPLNQIADVRYDRNKHWIKVRMKSGTTFSFDPLYASGKEIEEKPDLEQAFEAIRAALG
jgi:hypothetical protein